MDFKVIIVLFGTLFFKLFLDDVEGNIIAKEERKNQSVVSTTKIVGAKNYVDPLIDDSLKHEDNHENEWLEKEHHFGTVPAIPRTTLKHRERFKYSTTKAPNYSLKYNGGVEFAGLRLRSEGQGYIGANAYVAIHKPKVDSESHQFSSASIIIERGDNQIQAGWTVHPDLYHDNNPRFYIYWTRDNYKSTGCYNTDCPGFVIVSDTYPLNYAFPEISDPNKGVQHDAKISIEQRDISGRWYVSLNDNVLGYWPQSLFVNFGSADTIRWGGQVYSQPPTDESPPMGSGKFYGDNPYRTAYMKIVEVVFGDNTYGPPPGHLVEEVDTRCYFGGWESYSSDPSQGYHFLYGGKGGKARIAC
ncbi:hypothetical protein ACH5RR_034280 [Cinchona calisaya]|uniref:Neprosin PEP catalytic domain-containing protein n=1 Tax=Cinchona calisaya TaxID=153742 RepID=A0ABD2YE28_9GENT